MRGFRLVACLLYCLLSVPVFASDCSSLFARDLITENDYFAFNVYRVDGSHWGSWYLSAEDRTLSYYDAAFVKFQVDLDAFQAIVFEHIGGPTGELVVQWYDDYRLCIATMQKIDWNLMVSFVEYWPERSLFRSYNKIREVVIE